jgi:hypothetical protein
MLGGIKSGARKKYAAYVKVGYARRIKIPSQKITFQK